MERKGDGEGASFAKRTLNGEFTVHLLYQVFDDRHSKSGSGYFCRRETCLPCKWFKNFLEEFLGHTNSCILNHKLIPALGILVFNLPQAYGDRCSSLAVFQRIGDQIVDDLAQPERVTENVCIPDICVELKFLCSCSA